MRLLGPTTLLLALTACGSHHTGPGEVAYPDCGIWGQRLHTVPMNYGGCSQPDSTVVQAVGTACASGPALIRFGRAWAFEGGGVHVASGPLGKDAGYQSALKVCRR